MVDLALRADSGDREDEWVRDMQTEKIAEELLAQTESPQDAYEYAIRLDKGIEHNRTRKIDPFGGQTATTKQEPVHYINTRGRNNYTNNQSSQRARGGFRGRPYSCATQNIRGQQQRNTNFNTQNNAINVTIKMDKYIYTVMSSKR